MGLKLRNFTSHFVTIRTPERDINLDVDGEVASSGAPRIGVQRDDIGSLGLDLGEETEVEVPFSLSSPSIIGLPESDAHTVLIVDEELAKHPSTIERWDLLYVGEAIRDGVGRIEAYGGLCPGIGLARMLRHQAEKTAARNAAADLLELLRSAKDKAPESEATTDPPPPHSEGTTLGNVETQVVPPGESQLNDPQKSGDAELDQSGWPKIGRTPVGA